MCRLTNKWQGVEFRHLEVLQAIAERGTFWAAADLLDCSPSAVSQQVAALERLVGQRLVERSPGRRRVLVTEAGQLLVRHAEAIVARLRAAEADLSALASGAAGTLRVGTYQSVGARILPAVLREFAGGWPGIQVRLTEGAVDDEALLRMVERGELDLTFAALPLQDGPFEAAALLEDPCVLVVPRDAPLVSTPSHEQWAGLDLIGFCRGRLITAAEERLRRMGVEPQIVFRTDDNGTMQRLVAAGFGAALAPRLTVDEADPTIRVVPLDGFPSRLIGLAWHRDRLRSPALEGFVERARAVCAGLEGLHAAV
jgi:molybdate transport repressor ModE-like protein